MEGRWINGKLLGVILGLALGALLHAGEWSTVLALVGLILGHRLDSPTPPQTWSEAHPHPRTAPARPAPRIVDARPLRPPPKDPCQLLIEIARVDGEVARKEIRAIRRHFEQTLRMSGRDLDLLRQTLKEAIAAPEQLQAAATACGQLGLPERAALLDGLYQVATSDGALNRQEREGIRRAAAAMGVDPQDDRAAAERHLGPGGRYYQRLGLPPETTDEALKTTYRKLAAAHHPDKVSHLGAAAIREAEARFREIQEAYDEICRRRGL